MSESKQRYKSEEEIRAVVRGFEDSSTLPAEFDHRAHVTVAFAYLQLFGLTVPEAAERMRSSLYRFLDHHAPDRKKYNETITVFWIKLVRGFLDRWDTTQAIPDLANEIVDACGDSKVISTYYSKEHLASRESQSSWVEPDLRALEFPREC